MFTKLFSENVSEEQGDNLWNQCLQELMRVNGPGKPIQIEEVDRLAKLVSHCIYGDFVLQIQETVAEVINGFVDELPF